MNLLSLPFGLLWFTGSVVQRGLRTSELHSNQGSALVSTTGALYVQHFLNNPSVVTEVVLC